LGQNSFLQTPTNSEEKGVCDFVGFSKKEFVAYVQFKRVIQILIVHLQNPTNYTEGVICDFVVSLFYNVAFK
jgi:hypothetical protein